jgi:uncharacterized iron-regulated membrane protein
MTFKTLRKAVFSLHRIIGLLIGLLLIVIGLTGSLLVFEAEISDWLIIRQFGQVVPSNQRLAPDILLDITKTTYPSLKPVRLDFPDRSDQPFKIRMSSSRADDKIYMDGTYEVFVNPYTGKVLGDQVERSTYYRFLLNLHYRLLAEDIGVKIAGTAGFLLLVLSISGLILWSGWRKLISGFKIKWNAHPKRLNYDLHKVAGAVTAVFLIIVAATGAGWNFYEVTQPAIYALTSTPTRPEPQSKPIAGQSSLRLTEILAKAENAFPNGTVTTIYLPDIPEGTFTIYKKVEGGSEYGNAIYLDQFSGAVLRIDDEKEAALGDRILNTFIPLHFGTFGGLTTRILYVFIGLSPLILFVTGFVMWWYRRKPKIKQVDQESVLF